MSTNIIPSVSLADIGLNTPTQVNKKEDSQSADFLQLFVTQLKNQDPLEPEKGADFLAQLAQFSTVEGIKNMEQSLTNVASALSSSQALQATSLVGKKVEVLTNQAMLSNGEAIRGSMVLTERMDNLRMEIRNANGEVVKTYEYGSQAKGDFAFSWDGLDSDGQAVAPGKYTLTAMGSVLGKETPLNTYVASNVESVSINKNGQALGINITGLGQVSINDVKTIS
jgi:flagellar basal-body rod modification protein FlgD